MPVFVDTNIVIYAISNDPAEASKADRARAILQRDDVFISAQVLVEFYATATRARRGIPLTHAQAASVVNSLQRFRIVPADGELVSKALKLREKTNYSIWDCMVLAAASSANCEHIYTEDMQHGHEIDGLTIVNPFL